MNAEDAVGCGLMMLCVGIPLWWLTREWPAERAMRQSLVLSRLLLADADEWMPITGLEAGTGLPQDQLRRTLLQLLELGHVDTALNGSKPTLCARLTPTFRASPKFPFPSSAANLR